MRALGAGFLILWAAWAFGCGNPADWEPRGEVQWVQWKEWESGAGRVGQATYRLTNTGRVSVSVADLAVRLATDREVYYVQAEVKPDLPPGKSAFGTVEVLFRDPEDRGSLGGVHLESAAFH